MRPWIRKVWNFCFRQALRAPIRIKIMGIALGLVLTLGLAFLFWMRGTLYRTLEEQLRARGLALASDLATRAQDYVLVNDLISLYQLLQDTLENNPDVRYIFVVDPSGQVQAHTFGAVFPPDLLTVDHPSELVKPHHLTIETDEGRMHDVAAPIFGGRGGMVRLGITEQSLHETLARATYELIVITGIASLLGIGAALLLTLNLTRPILELASATHALSHGDFAQHVTVHADDEIGRLGEAFNLMIERLDTSRRLQTQLLRRLMSAQEEERKRIARELHDQTSQSLTSLMVGLKVLETTVSTEEAQKQVQALRSLTGQILEEIHHLSANLRPNVLDDLGLVIALQQYVQQFSERFHLAIDFQAVGMEGVRLGSDVEMALYRIVQEALSNVIKHARAQNASVLLECRDKAVVLIVEDDGVGFDPAAVMQSKMEDKLGLFGMQERATLIDGTLTIESAPGQGTTLFVEIPLSSPPQP